MIPHWQEQIKDRILHFSKDGNDAISIKFKVKNGCFHREHSPESYRIIDEYIKSLDNNEFHIIEHESGLEIIAFINSVTAIINFISAVLKARADGIKKGDRNNPVEVIFRRIDRSDEYIEEIIIKADDIERINDSIIKNAVTKSRFITKKQCSSI